METFKKYTFHEFLNLEGKEFQRYESTGKLLRANSWGVSDVLQWDYITVKEIQAALSSDLDYQKLIEICKDKDIALLAIKTLSKGKLFTTKKTTLSAYYSGGKAYNFKLDKPITPAQCFKYAFDQGVDSVVFGVQTVEQLQENGKIIIPVGEKIFGQELVVITRKEGKFIRDHICGVSFVPLIGEHGFSS